MRDHLLAIGIMTGNSLDGADLVLSRIGRDLSLVDLAAYSVRFPVELVRALRILRSIVEQNEGRVEQTALTYPEALLALSTTGQKLKKLPQTLDQLHNHYLKLMADAVKALMVKAKGIKDLAGKYDFDQIDLIGFHGQTCTHLPPTVAQVKDLHSVYTVQFGSGQVLADLTGISVVYDFRSDDLMNGGEGAPLAPLHHLHLATALRREGVYPIAFCNAGNTGNITIVSEECSTEQLRVFGWDSGPFNHYPDSYVSIEKGERCDQDGKYGRKGQINLALLEILFETAVITKEGRNFLNLEPPRSCDPSWYVNPAVLVQLAEKQGLQIEFCDCLRTFEYFSAYIMAHSLSFVPEQILMPLHFALSGGGWNNPVVKDHFTGLLSGDLEANPILPQHSKLFQDIRNRMMCRIDPDQVGQEVQVGLSKEYGFDGIAMEARIFADAAVCRIKGEPFSLPAITGVKEATIDGILRFPKGNRALATESLLSWLDHYKFESQPFDRPDLFDERWSRASAGWYEKLL